MSSRMEELESKIVELQATINGLIEKLVETKEQPHQPEDANDVQIPLRAVTRRGDWETKGQADTEAAAAKSADADETSPIDIDETKPDEADETDEGDGKTFGDDIIVA